MDDLEQVPALDPARMQIHEVTAIHETVEDGVLRIEANVTDATGDTFDAIAIYRPDDPHGLTPAFTEWLAENPDFPRQPYQPPTPEKIREHMQDLTARQLRLALINNDITLSQVTTAIGSIPTEIDRDKAMVEWEYASNFSRMHPLIAMVGGALGLTDEQIDAMWLDALPL